MGAGVFALSTYGKVQEAVLEPTIEKEEKRRKKQAAEEDVIETAKDTFLIRNKKTTTGKKLKPYYINLQTMASQIYDNLNGSIFFKKPNNTIVLITQIYPYMMRRLSVIYKTRFNKELISDIIKHTNKKQQNKIRTWLNKI